MAIDLVRPGTLPDEVIVSTSASGWITIGRDEASDDFVVKMQRGRFQFRVPAVETTGDGDKVPVIETAALLYGDFTVTGFMCAGSAFGLRAMRDQVRNGVFGESQFRMAVELDGRHALNNTNAGGQIPCVLVQVGFEWSANGGVVPVQIGGSFTDAATGGTNGIDVRQ